ncbi:MAG: BREX-1 system phosphatase PglZ type A [Desulfamplus sp.]
MPKNSTLHQNDFEVLSDQCADILSIEKELQHREISALEEIDCFELVDRKILSELVKSVVNQTIPANVRENLIRQRKLSHWYNRYCDLYEAIDYGARFIKAVEEADLNIESINSGIANYTNSWFLIDKLYRKYIFHTRKSGQVSMLNLLSDKVEKIYSNNYLLVVNNNWQKIIDKCSKWGEVTVTLSSFPVTTVSAASTIVVGLQRSFFKKKVLPFIRDNKKVFVIISDALRFEIGEELLSMIRQEDRFDAELEPMLSMLPSFTQLGMASLLPNNEIKFVDTDASTVLVDGQSSKGTENRTKILNNAVKGQAKAMRADELMAMNRDECRELFREHELVYIYHNRIDSTGDNKESEGGVFDAVDETLEELIKIIKKLAGANATNLIVTADHGFIYQNRAIEESDFLGNSVGYSDTQSTNSINVDSAKEGVPKILSYHRRFLLGKNLTENNSLKLFTSQQAGLEGDMDIQIPKSINRIRLKGSGSRFVHGGASLQEVIIPVVKIHKKRQSDTSQVEVDILGSSTSVITTGQFSAAFYQAQPVTEKVQPRILRAGIYSKDGVLLSDSNSLSFDFKSDNPRGREIKVRFILTRKADESNEQEVFLKLEELVSGTSYYKEYKSAKYVIRRSFTSDFDF